MTKKTRYIVCAYVLGPMSIFGISLFLKRIIKPDLSNPFHAGLIVLCGILILCSYISTVFKSRKERYIVGAIIVGPMAIAAAFWMLIVIGRPDLNDPSVLRGLILLFTVGAIPYVWVTVRQYYRFKEWIEYSDNPDSVHPFDQFPFSKFPHKRFLAKRRKDSTEERR